MALTAFVEPPARTVVWMVSLLWMGGACFANARRCSRTHCRFTGPFFILMAMSVVAYANDILILGPHGWSILGGITLAGTVAIWWVSEHIWGKFLP